MWAKGQFLPGNSDDKEKPQLKRLKPKIEVKDIILQVGKAFDCPAEKILEKGKKRNLARDVSTYLAWNLSGKRGNTRGKIFWNVSGAAITMRQKAVAEKICEEKRLKTKINSLVHWFTK